MCAPGAELPSLCALLIYKFVRRQGLAPQLHIHNTSDLSLLQKITWGTQAGYVAIAFSGDGKRLAAVEQEQNSRLVVWDWQEVLDMQPFSHKLSLKDIPFLPRVVCNYRQDLVFTHSIF